MGVHWPWLDAVASFNRPAAVQLSQHTSVRSACSALKRRYRNILIGDDTDVIQYYCKAAEELIARPIATRHERFMHRAAYFHSQFEALEEPALEKNTIIVSIETKPPRLWHKFCQRGAW